MCSSAEDCVQGARRRSARTVDHGAHRCSLTPRDIPKCRRPERARHRPPGTSARPSEEAPDRGRGPRERSAEEQSTAVLARSWRESSTAQRIEELPAGEFQAVYRRSPSPSRWRLDGIALGARRGRRGVRRTRPPGPSRSTRRRTPGRCRTANRARFLLRTPRASTSRCDPLALLEPGESCPLLRCYALAGDERARAVGLWTAAPVRGAPAHKPHSAIPSARLAAAPSEPRQRRATLSGETVHRLGEGQTAHPIGARSVHGAGASSIHGTGASSRSGAAHCPVFGRGDLPVEESTFPTAIDDEYS